MRLIAFFVCFLFKKNEKQTVERIMCCYYNCIGYVSIFCDIILIIFMGEVINE